MAACHQTFNMYYCVQKRGDYNPVLNKEALASTQ
jgi:hypothetical protein